MFPDWLEEDSLAPLRSGSLVVSHRAANRPWAAAWEFTDAETTWHAVLAGDEGIHQLRPGTADRPAQVGGGRSFTDWLMETKPQDKTTLNFRQAMQNTQQPVTFAISSATGCLINRLGVIRCAGQPPVLRPGLEELVPSLG